MTIANTASASTNRVSHDFEKPLWRRVLISRESGIVALLILVTLYATVAVRGFGQPITLNYLLLDVAPILLIALPMTLIMITGEIDLSVGSMVGLASVVTGAGVQAGLPFEVAALILTVAIIAAIPLTLRHRAGVRSQDPARQVRVQPRDRIRVVKMAAEKPAAKPESSTP